MGISKNRGGPPKSSILIGFSIINHPFWGEKKHTPIFGNTHIELHQLHQPSNYSSTSNKHTLAWLHLAISTATNPSTHRTPSDLLEAWKIAEASFCGTRARLEVLTNLWIFYDFFTIGNSSQYRVVWNSMHFWKSGPGCYKNHLHLPGPHIFLTHLDNDGEGLFKGNSTFTLVNITHDREWLKILYNYFNTNNITTKPFIHFIISKSPILPHPPKKIIKQYQRNNHVHSIHALST